MFSGHLLSLQSYRSAFLPRFFFCPVVLSCINGRIMFFVAISFSSSSSKGIFRLPASVILFRLKNVVIVVIRNSRWATASYLLLSCILNYVFFENSFIISNRRLHFGRGLSVTYHLDLHFDLKLCRKIGSIH